MMSYIEKTFNTDFEMAFLKIVESLKKVIGQL